MVVDVRPISRVTVARLQPAFIFIAFSLSIIVLLKLRVNFTRPRLPFACVDNRVFGICMPMPVINLRCLNEGQITWYLKIYICLNDKREDATKPRGKHSLTFKGQGVEHLRFVH